MSFRALPLQFLNLGGEMMYIIDQRLRAQNICDDRAHKVRNDILSIMLSKQFVDELFHPQPLYSRIALRTVFDKLAHASIMKLNPPSMDKLFELMLMSLKHQIVLVPRPSDLLLVTMNHLDSMVQYATAPDVFDQVNRARFYFLKMYSDLLPYEWVDIRRDLLMFLQDLHVRVSIFLKTGIQDHFGTLILPIKGPVPDGCEVPGRIRFFNPCGEVSLVTLFPSGGNYACAVNAIDCADPCADRHVQLGLNIYTFTDEEKVKSCSGNLKEDEDMAYQNFGPEETDEKSDSVAEPSSAQGKEELNLLAMLIGKAVTSQTQSNKEFRLNLFLNEDFSNSDEKGMKTSDDVNRVITIDGGTRKEHPELEKIFGELCFDDLQQTTTNQEEQDLLDLLDSA